MNRDQENFLAARFSTLLRRLGVGAASADHDRWYLSGNAPPAADPLRLRRSLGCKCGWSIDIDGVAELTTKLPLLWAAMNQHALEVRESVFPTDWSREDD